MLGYATVGVGPRKVVILNDWLCDTSTWDTARAYLDGDTFTWAFADLRGYGRSRDRPGTYTVAEAAVDVLGVADGLGWPAFAIVGHSMSSLVALHLAQHQSTRIAGAVVLAPPPPTSFGVDDATCAAMQAVARGDDATRLANLKASWGDRLSDGWLRFKVARWRATADPEAVAGYVPMFAQAGLPTPAARIDVPLLAVTGEQDRDLMRCAAVTTFLRPLGEQLTVIPLADSGHYPMQEVPPRVVALLERFLGGA